MNLTQSDIDRFWNKVDVRGPDECWLWKAGTFGTGYGDFRICGKDVGAHRFSFELANGSIPGNVFVCHSCDNRLCVNPSHLFLGSAADNNLDMTNKHRVCNGEHHHWAKLSDKQVFEIRDKYQSGQTQRSIAAEFCTDQSNVHYIVTRKSRRHI